MFFSVVVLVLTKALVAAEVCHTLNVTVTPGPSVMVPEKDNLTLSCLVSQRKRSGSVLILRWFFTPHAGPTLPPPTSPTPAPQQPSQFLIAKLGIKKLKLYGNYTRRFPQPKFRLFEETEGEAYRLWILNVTRVDQGFYSCRVQEIRKHRNTWRASSNGSSTMQLTVHRTLEDGAGVGVWRLFADVYLCAVLICSLGLLSIFLFTLILACQYLHRRHRLKASYLLVKCPESSSGETVTSSSSSSNSSPRAQRRDTSRKTDRRPAVKPPEPPEEPPPHIPVKVPVAAKRPQKPRRLKNPRTSAPPRASQEESLTYAELELVRPRPEPPASSRTDPTPCSPDTVYAQILFQEKQL
ncbi:V-set and transmembrane domain-containing protein 4a isoform X2 [Takifugu rubripes]|uniref:V-set and transmembrane domain-containing protein 4a isoform X2 n=1 Tax=Takifugu rubripes TaxID=31033 RepID=UPI0005D19ABF|nr:V-set and transmembrane domain-containing protein 4-like isoform X2 [Takifugu rubripes]|eukprot:XP_011601685.1 PREDICTED: V-set and transmembrane domain-containing protein 4-like isoform X1 [Takifugu rubripes]